MQQEYVNVGDGNGEDISVSAKLPIRGVYLALAAVLSGGLGIGATMPRGIENKAIESCFDNAADANRKSERAAALADTLTRVIERMGQQLADSDHRSVANESRLEALRVYVLERTSDRYTKSEAENAQRRNDREHAVLDSRIDVVEKRRP